MQIQYKDKIFDIKDKFIFTSEVKYIFDIFIKNGDEIRLVGGCVRDFLLGLKINDYDFATKYEPKDIVLILKQNNIEYFTIGEKFGTITAIVNDKKFEITTLRKDFNQDGRHTNVSFTNEYVEDARRRDFTFNALYIDCKYKIYDYFNGYQDLQKGLVKFIGKPNERIVEDYLRILRFFRFFAYCGKFFDYKSLKYCKKYGNYITKLSIERITSEFLKILLSKYPLKVLSIMQNIDILKHIISFKQEINFDSLLNFCSIKNFVNFDYDYIFVLTIFLLNNDVEKINLLFSNKEKKNLNDLQINKFIVLDEFEIKKKVFLFKDKIFVKKLLILYFCEKNINFLIFRRFFNFIDAWEIPNFVINGYDLIDCGFFDRKKYSVLLQTANEIFINSNFKLDKKEILHKLKEYNI